MHINRAVAIATLSMGHYLNLPLNYKYSEEEIAEAIELLESLKTVEVELCHCSRPVHYYDDIKDSEGNPFTRGLCEHCSNVRCDKYPGTCQIFHYPEEKKEISDYLDSELKKGDPFP